MKKISKIAFFVSLAIIVTFLSFSIYTVISSINSSSGSMGIVGGADGPTAIMIFSSFFRNNLIFSIFCISHITLVTSAICWIKSRKQ